jgi:hypothetical protein
VVLFFVLGSLFLLVEQDARIDPAAGIVICEGRLFGRYLVWRWKNPLNDFIAVGLRRQTNPENGDTIFVGLQRRSGRLVALQYFFAGQARPCPEAQQAARRLADTTGLQVKEEVT